jgi:hypothetical protein
VNIAEAKRSYINRYTMEHVPSWALRHPHDSGGTEQRYYAPQFRTDDEWFENTLFPPNNPCGTRITDCYTTGQTWPLGQWLNKPFRG